MNFVAIAEHTPAQCPGTNDEVFQTVSSSMPSLSDLEKKHGVTNVGIHVMIGAHKIVVILNAPSFEAAELVLLESKLVSWNTIQLSQTYSREEAMKLTRI
jgi:hypothetical protein